ncbi:MAG: hypothetical protein KJ592_00645 [Nanoarchaeota archaeon]|nr:hypothetical protein [Nanoarchaeota archaeon]
MVTDERGREIMAMEYAMEKNSKKKYGFQLCSFSKGCDLLESCLVEKIRMQIIPRKDLFYCHDVPNIERECPMHMLYGLPDLLRKKYDESTYNEKLREICVAVDELVHNLHDSVMEEYDKLHVRSKWNEFVEGARHLYSRTVGESL